MWPIMTRQRQWLVVLLWGAAGCFGQQATAVGQDLLVANNTASFNESILRFSATGECLGNFAQTPYRSGPVGLAFDPTGNLYVANHSNNSIHRYSRSGDDLGVFATAGLNMPTGLAFNRLGQLVVCNYGDGSLSFFSATGTWLARVDTGLLNPLALALDSCDNIFVSTPDIGAHSGVFRFAPQGTQRTLFAAGIDLDPRGLAFDRTGNLYVANQHGSSVRRYSAEGIFLDAFATGLRDPFALAFDADGDLYVSNQAGGTIRRYSACGEDLGIFATVPATFANPVGLAFLPVPEPTVPVLLILSAGIIRLISNHQTNAAQHPRAIHPRTSRA
jgi:DNA-binding beta-propeller fold protein YncE